jgi:paraquat-inducible protein B
MFGTLRQNNTVYILDKGETPKLEFGTVVSSIPKIGTYQNAFNNTVDIKVKVDDTVKEFNQLPSNLSKTYYNNSIVVTSDKESMLQEVDGFIRNSQQIIDSIPYHKKVIETGDEMLALLNPQIAKDKANEEKINQLETKVSNIDERIGTMMGMLSKALGNNQ